MKNKLIFLIIFFIFFIFSASATTIPPFENIIISKEPIKYKKIIFQNFYGKKINLNNFDNNIYLLNFWATWCNPCKREMPSLDKLQNLSNIKIFPINIENKNKNISEIFFEKLKIKNLSIYFDSDSMLANLFRLRGIPTTIILNKKREEIGRIIGEFNFSDEKFINWINEINNSNYS